MIARTPTRQQRLDIRNRPDERPLLKQTWKDLLFLHWRLAPAEVQKTLPPELTVDTFHGKAFIGVIPFLVRGTRMKPLPAFPRISDFYELNVRTYVHDAKGNPGVWFYSLDCSQALAVAAARAAYSLPYFPAAIRTEVGRDAHVTNYFCQRTGQPQISRYEYGVGEPLGQAAIDTLDYFLIERYSLFSRSSAGTVYSARVWHQPYSLFKAHLVHHDDVMLRLNGFGPFIDPPSHVIFSNGVEVDIHPPCALTPR